MGEFFDTIFRGDLGGNAGGLEAALLGLLVAFIAGHVIAWVYMGTHTGLSYSQMFTASLVVIPVLVGLFMMLVASNAFIALGMLGVFTMIRFRNVLKDTRDTTFILWSVVEGMAAGTGHYAVAIIGALGVGVVYAYLYLTVFGVRHRYDVVVSFQCSGGGESLDVVRGILQRHAARLRLASQRDLDESNLDLSYRILLRDPQRSRELLVELRTVTGIQNVTLYHREDESEI